MEVMGRVLYVVVLTGSGLKKMDRAIFAVNANERPVILSA
jgi:hypothetical protein